MRSIAAGMFYLQHKSYSTSFMGLFLTGWGCMTALHYFGSAFFSATGVLMKLYMVAFLSVLAGELFLLVLYVGKNWWCCRGYEFFPAPPTYNMPYHEYRGRRFTAEQLKKEQVMCAHITDAEERITGASIKALNGVVWNVESPGRHHHCIWWMGRHDAAETHIKDNTKNQGFMTNKGRYINRAEARALAIANGQVLEKDIVSAPLIHSEDLWVTPLHMQHRPNKLNAKLL